MWKYNRIIAQCLRDLYIRLWNDPFSVYQDSTCPPIFKKKNTLTHISQPRVTHKRQSRKENHVSYKFIQHLRIEDGLKMCRNVSLNKPFRSA